MRKLAIIALAALTLAPSAANANWHDFTCLMFGANCHRSPRYQGPWWEGADPRCDVWETGLGFQPAC